MKLWIGTGLPENFLAITVVKVCRIKEKEAQWLEISPRDELMAENY